MIYCGVDPGNKGAICLLQVVPYLSVEFLPNKPSRELYNYLYMLNIRNVTIEEVHSIHKVSAKSNFTFGRNLGLLEGMFLSLDCTLNYVQPKKWQQYYNLNNSEGNIKQLVASKATELYPSESSQFYGPRGGLKDGVTDSLLIAHYIKENT